MAMARDMVFFPSFLVGLYPTFAFCHPLPHCPMPPATVTLLTGWFKDRDPMCAIDSCCAGFVRCPICRPCNISVHCSIHSPMVCNANEHSYFLSMQH